MTILAKNEAVIFIGVFLAVIVVTVLLWWLYQKCKVAADLALGRHLGKLGLEPTDIKSSWFPPAKLLPHHRKGVLWYTITLKDGSKKYARIYMLLTKVISLKMFD